ncbi:MAG: hypothetical protein ABIJ08_02310 [Nanoarchaeota archaeon]
MKQKDKPRLTEARNRRKAVYKYYPIEGDKLHKFSVPAGRCYKCGKITDAYCDKCHKWICENHIVKGKEEGECYCNNCIIE